MEIRETLIAAMQASGNSLNELSRQTGIPQATLSRFQQNETDVRLTVVQTLATYFNLELRPASTPAASSTKKPKSK